MRCCGVLSILLEHRYGAMKKEEEDVEECKCIETFFVCVKRIIINLDQAKCSFILFFLSE